MNLSVAYLTWMLLGVAAWPVAWRLGGKRPGNVVPVYLARAITLAFLGLTDFFVRSLVGENSPANLHLILPMALVVLAWLPVLWPRMLLPGAEGEADANSIEKWLMWPFRGIRSFKDHLPAFGAMMRATLAWEAIGLVCFSAVLAFLAIRTPVMQVTEQFADLASLQSVARSPALPPDDAWFSGYKLNYHYLSFVPYARLGQVVGPSLQGGTNSPTTQPTNAGQTQPTSAEQTQPINAGQAPSLKVLSPWPTVYVFSLAIAYSLGMMMAGGLVYSLSGRWWTVPMAILLLFAAGNLEPALRQNGAKPGQPLPATTGEWLKQINVWESSRVIIDGPGRETINEYPLFSLHIGDLHPHVLNLPMVLAVAACLASLIRLPPWPGWTAMLTVAVLVSFAAVSMLLDIPGLALVVLVGLVARILPASGEKWIQRMLLISPPTWGLAIAVGILVLGTMSIFSGKFHSPVGGVVLDRNLAGPILNAAFTLETDHQRPADAAKVLFESATQPATPDLSKPLYFPEAFYLLMSNAIPGVKWVDFPQSKWGEWMMLFALPLALLVTALWVSHVRAVKTTGAGNALWLAIILFAVAFGFTQRTVSGYLPWLTAVVLWVCCLRAAWRDRADRLQAFSFLLASVGLVLIAVPELMVIQDQYGDNYRINTLFKFYYQAQCWLLLSGIALLSWKFAPPKDVSENELAYQEQTGLAPVNACLNGEAPAEREEVETSGMENLWLALVMLLAGMSFVPLLAIVYQDVQNALPRQDKRLARQLMQTCPAAKPLGEGYLHGVFQRLRQGDKLDSVPPPVKLAAEELFVANGGTLPKADGSKEEQNWWSAIGSTMKDAGRACQQVAFFLPQHAANLDGNWWFRQDLPPEYAGDLSAAAFLAAHPPQKAGECLLEAAISNQYGHRATGYGIAGRLGLFGNWPSVMAWPNTHQVRRPSYPLPGETDSQTKQVWDRVHQVQMAYEDPSSPQTVACFDKWKVHYVAVGKVEEEAYGEDISKLWKESGWRLVHDGKTRIYDVSTSWNRSDVPPPEAVADDQEQLPEPPTSNTGGKP